MGWGGIKNVPPGFDVFGGKAPPPNIVEEAIRGKVAGLHASRESLFADLKRNLLHQDFARYFDSCVTCSRLLEDIDGGKYHPQVVQDIVAPALATAVAQMESIRSDAERARTLKRPMQYEPQPSLDMLYTKARALAQLYPDAPGAANLDERYREISESTRALLVP
jgi:hypothetical protein